MKKNNLNEVEMNEKMHEETHNLFVRFFKMLFNFFRGKKISDAAENENEREILERIDQINETYHENIIKIEEAKRQGIMPGTWITQEIINAASDVNEQNKEEAEDLVNKAIEELIDKESLNDSEELENDSLIDLTTQKRDEDHEKES